MIINVKLEVNSEIYGKSPGDSGDYLPRLAGRDVLTDVAKAISYSANR